MGYTNRFKHRPPTADETQAVIEDIKTLIRNSGTAMTVATGPGQISINGRRPHDTQVFQWPITTTPPGADTPDDETRTHYCKTERKKYDMVVLAALLTIKHHIPDAEIATDDCCELKDLHWTMLNDGCARDCNSIVELLMKMRWNEFSKQHQRGADLYQRTFPERNIADVRPWPTVT